MRTIYKIKDKNDNIILDNIVNLNEAILLANKTIGLKVCDNLDKVVHVSTKKDENEKIITNVKSIGQGVRLYKTNLFKSPTSAISHSKITGTYYIFDSKPVNGRYKIVDDKSKIGKSSSVITGYINIEDCK